MFFTEQEVFRLKIWDEHFHRYEWDAKNLFNLRKTDVADTANCLEEQSLFGLIYDHDPCSSNNQP